MAEPLAYFLTFTTYGTWLHGRPEGSVDRNRNLPGEPFLPADLEMEQTRRQNMRQEPYILDEARRAVVLRTIREVAAHRRWRLWAVHARTNHVYIVVTAIDKPEKVMTDFKAWASRRLREAFVESADRDRWTQHGSTIYLKSQAALESKCIYVIDEQGEKMAYFDGRNEPDNEPEA